MRSTIALLIGLVLAMGCDQPGPLAPSDPGPAFAKHQITHIDETSGTFELRGLSGCFGELVVVTGTALNMHLVGNRQSVKLKLALHVVLPGDGGSPKVVVNAAKGPCAPNE